MRVNEDIGREKHAAVESAQLDNRQAGWLVPMQSAPTFEGDVDENSAEKRHELGGPA